MEHLSLPSNWETLLTGYVLGDLSPEEAAVVKQYLETYPQLTAEVESLQATLALFPLSLPKTKPSENLREQILQAAETDLLNTAQTQENNCPTPSPSPPTPPPPPPSPTPPPSFFFSFPSCLLHRTIQTLRS